MREAGEMTDAHHQVLSGSAFMRPVARHPCFSEEAHFKFGRIHLPVSPACNIQCRFCRRGYNKWEQRPAVSRKLLTPAGAVEMVARAIQICPDLTVVGIAGPGEALATGHALETFKLVHEAFPALLKCLSTNGLLLAQHAEELICAGVRTVSVTVNAVDPDVLEQICAAITLNGREYRGSEGARRLISAQVEGIAAIHALGATVKVNTVLIPGINEGHVARVAKVASECGASLVNVIPLIPQFGFASLRAPDCGELKSAQAAAEQFLPVFRRCRQCRADACGVPGLGDDLARHLYDESLQTFSHG